MFLVLCVALELSLVNQTLREQHHNCVGEEETDKCEKTFCITDFYAIISAPVLQLPHSNC